MPPKKSVKILKTAQDKAPRRRQKKEKCLPIIDTDHDHNQKDEVIPLGKNDIKIMLANEVVGRQFKKKISTESADKPVCDTILKESKSGVNLKNNVALKRKLEKEESPKCLDVPLKKRGRRSVPLKTSEDVPESVPKCEPPIETNESVPVPCKKGTRKPVRLKGNKTEPKVDIVDHNLTTEDDIETTKPKLTKRKPIKNNKVKCGPRTRQSVNDLKESQVDNVTQDNDPTQVTINASERNVVEVRRNSVASSELSWTKDISSSSTTTCVTVCSNDFFRIDKKIPFVRLTNFKTKLNGEKNNNVTIEVQSENISKDGAFTNCEISNEKLNCEDEVELPYPDPKTPILSSSSSESCTNLDKPHQNDTSVNKLSTTLDKLSAKLKNIDLEIINWIGYTNDDTNPNIGKIQDKLFHDSFLKDEFNIIVHCQNIKRILCDNIQTPENMETKTSEVNVIQTDHENETFNNSNIKDYLKDMNPKESLNVISNVIVQKNTNHMETSTSKSMDNSPRHNPLRSDEEDEDDALSLFAESITGIEHSAKNNTTSSRIVNRRETEEYVPQSIVKNKSPLVAPVIYYPTRIDGAQSKVSQDDSVIVSADSTSVYREQDNDINQSGPTRKFKTRFSDVEDVSRRTNGTTRPVTYNQLMSSLYNPISIVKSFVFKGVCFYNLISKCKKNSCKFPHLSVSVETVNNKLKTLNEATLIQEYIMLRSWSCLRQMYGTCYVEEFVARGLTSRVIEIAFDFITRERDKALVINIVEYVLLYLNKVDLSKFEGFLTLTLKPTTALLCDYFVETIAVSQNFSRFKSVFINLTDLMCRNGRTFSGHVAGLLLERIVILPYEDALARALISIIKNSEVDIYSNLMMGHLEQQLMSSNMELYEELIAMKSHSGLDSCYADGDRSKRLDKDIRCSPDTTNMDNMNKSSIETKFTRMIDLNKLNSPNVNSIVPGFSEDNRFSTSLVESWRDRQLYDNMRRGPRDGGMRPPLRRPFKRRMGQNFGRSTDKFQRGNGTIFFKIFSKSKDSF